ncbi:hypothetical protein H9X90_04305 [Faecalicatena contorta]|uniref:hypothetical protein n=1 Tax=Faecalicatena contorta TaxID=39482 RepID=UPI00195F578A|nr:hypothetical protein [Faecalicatena contorta]MBM6684843.1 hypothetical protein [Faecalicatena contorta]MBM6709974.1 hypothetical protein [Faecalicatena contorta]
MSDQRTAKALRKSGEGFPGAFLAAQGRRPGVGGRGSHRAVGGMADEKMEIARCGKAGTEYECV